MTRSASFLSICRRNFCVSSRRRSFVPSGSTQVRRSDFRVISATNRDLAAEVEKGTFRRDLYFRLNVITLRLPPLRSRVEDIPDLVEHFLRRYGRGHVMSGEAMEALLSYEWPGNVRQLEHCIQHMVAVNSGPVLHSRDLPTMLINHLQQPSDQTCWRWRMRSASNASPVDSLPPPIVPLAGAGEARHSRRHPLHER